MPTSSDIVTVTLTSKADFDVGGRSGNVVTSSDNTKVGKGWRLLQLDGTDVPTSPSEVRAALSAARRGRHTASFFGGKRAGGGGMHMNAPMATQARAEASSSALSAGDRSDVKAGKVRAAQSENDLRRLRTEFISFDLDRDGELGLKDWGQMLIKLNAEYEFMERSGPTMGEYVKGKWYELGGRRANPDDSDDDDDNVVQAGFNAWYDDFIAQCEQKKRREYEATKPLTEEQFEQHWGEKSMRSRTEKFPLLRHPVFSSTTRHLAGAARDYANGE